MNFNINISPFERGEGSESPAPGSSRVVTPGIPPPAFPASPPTGDQALRDLYAKFQKYTIKMQKMESQNSELKLELATRERTLRKTTEALRVREVENERLRVEVSNLSQILAREQSHVQAQNEQVVRALQTHAKMINEQRQKSEDSNTHQNQLADIVDGLREIVLEREQMQLERQQQPDQKQIIPVPPDAAPAAPRPAYIQMSPPPPPPVLNIPDALLSSISSAPPADGSLPPELLQILQQIQHQYR